jgi:hypothetical protein
MASIEPRPSSSYSALVLPGNRLASRWTPRMRLTDTLRPEAIGADLTSIAFGYFGRLAPVLLLHTLLLPTNIDWLVDLGSAGDPHSGRTRHV